MLFREANISNYAEALWPIQSFAQDLGFYAATSGSKLTLRAQATTGAGSPRPAPQHYFVIETNSAGEFFGLHLAEGVSTVHSQSIDHYRVRAQDGVSDLTPSKVTMFGFHPTGAWTQGQKNPWIALVFTYEFNYYRHVYLGHMDRAGGYTGGEVMSIANGPDYRVPAYGIPVPTPVKQRDSAFAHHFGANNKMASTGPNPTLPGVPLVHVAHANNPYPYRPLTALSFYDTGNAVLGPAEPLPGGVMPGWPAFALGGFGDGPNDPLMEMSHGEACNAHILTPINLYMTDLSGRYVPLGSPAGIRFANMRDIAPEQSIAIGNDLWRVFPEIHRSVEPLTRATMDTTDGLGQKRRQSSWLVGYAYPENPS